MKLIRNMMPSVLGCSRVTLWAKDLNMNQVYSFIDLDREARFETIDDIVGFVLNN